MLETSPLFFQSWRSHTTSFLLLAAGLQKTEAFSSEQWQMVVYGHMALNSQKAQG